MHYLSEEKLGNLEKVDAFLEDGQSERRKIPESHADLQARYDILIVKNNEIEARLAGANDILS
jgi:hypothetical protein